ncbi:MAG: hypothetical protein IPK11_04385 [Ignavibacteria bacterium]|nr:hypothetical protein [Ignavibacteria bacterium]
MRKSSIKNGTFFDCGGIEGLQYFCVMIMKYFTFFFLCFFFPLFLFAQDQWEWEKVPLPQNFTISNIQQLRNGNIIVGGVNNYGEWTKEDGLWIFNKNFDSLLYDFSDLPHVYNITEHNNDIYARFKMPNSTLFTDNSNTEKHILKSTNQGKSWLPHQLIFRIDTFRKYWRFAYDTLRAASNFFSINDSILIASCWHLPITDIGETSGRITRSRKSHIYLFKSLDHGKTWTSILSKEFLCTYDDCIDTRLSYDEKTQYIYCDFGDYDNSNPPIYRFRLHDTVPEIIPGKEYYQFALRNNHKILQKSRNLAFFDGDKYIRISTPFDTIPQPVESRFAVCIDRDSSFILYSPTTLYDNYSDKVQLWRLSKHGTIVERIRTPFDSIIRYFTVLNDGRYCAQTYHHQFWISTDRGSTWNQQYLNLDRTRIMSITFDKQRRIYVGTYAGQGLLRSNQQTWQWEYLGGKSKTQSHVAVADDGTVFRTQRECYAPEYYTMYHYDFHRLFRLSSGSTVWDTLDVNPSKLTNGTTYPTVLTLDKENALYISSENCVQRSTDNGTTWQLIERCVQGMPNTLCFLPDSSILFGALKPTLWKNGKSHLTILPGLKDFGYTSALYSKALQTCFITYHGAAIRSDFSNREAFLYLSQDNGQTWDSISIYSIEKMIAPNPSEVTDPGRFLCADSVGGIYLYDYWAPILRSSDRGSTWKIINGNLPPLPEYTPYIEATVMAASPEGWIYVGTATHGLWRSRLRFPPVGVKEEEETPSTLRIMPNPANTFLSLSGTDNALVFIADMQGSLMYQGYENSIDISRWQTGMYCARIPATGQKALFMVVR